MLIRILIISIILRAKILLRCVDDASDLKLVTLSTFGYFMASVNDYSSHTIIKIDENTSNLDGVPHVNRGEGQCQLVTFLNFLF